MRTTIIDGPRAIRLRCDVPSRLRERARGLLFRPPLRRDEALLLPNATSVHTFGMRFPILVVRLDRSFRVVDVRLVPPWRIVLPIRRGRHVLECHPDVGLRIGDELRTGDVRRS